MSKHTVEIGDDEGNSFKISINIGYIGISTEGSWRSMDKGWIRYNSGLSKKQRTNGWNPGETNLFLYQSEGTAIGPGIRLDKWDDLTGVNDQGTGEIAQPWVTGAKPGKISWALVE